MGYDEIIAVFIGSWVGENRIDGDLTTWVQNRFADETYTILFVTISGNEVSRNVESGKWWITDGLFYELSSNAMGKPDVYKYTIRSTDNIYFENTSVDYQFAESRAIENHFDIINIE